MIIPFHNLLEIWTPSIYNRHMIPISINFYLLPNGLLLVCCCWCCCFVGFFFVMLSFWIIILKKKNFHGEMSWNMQGCENSWGIALQRHTTRRHCSSRFEILSPNRMSSIPSPIAPIILQSRILNSILTQFCLNTFWYMFIHLIVLGVFGSAMNAEC